MNISAAVKKVAKGSPWVCLLVLVASNTLLIRQNLQMRAQLDKLNPYLKKGDTVPGFSAGGLNGEAVNVSYTGSGKRYVFFFLSPNCPYSREQFAYWKEIQKAAGRDRFEVLGLVRESEDVDKVAGHIRSVSPPTDSMSRLQIAVVPQSVLDSYKLTVTPITLTVSSSGEVENIWVGKWNDDTAATASSYFGFQFPRLRQY